MSPSNALAQVAINVGISGALAYLLFRFLAPRPPLLIATQVARRWGAWAIAVCTVTLFPKVVRSQFGADAVAIWLLGIVVLGGAAFLVGLAWASATRRRVREPADAVRPETIEGPSAAPARDAPMNIPDMEETHVVHSQDDVYERIAEELEGGPLQKGLWTRLFAECDGDENRTKVAYIKERAAQLLRLQAADRLGRRSASTPAPDRRLGPCAEGPRPDPELADAVWSGNWSRASALLAAGRPAQGIDERGMSLIDLAAKRGDRLMLELLERHFSHLGSRDPG